DRLAAARRKGLRLRPDLPRRGAGAHVRGDDARGEAAADPSRARLRTIARRARMSAFGIYVHWPYCARICPYCDFNVYRARGAGNEALIAAIEADLAAHASRFGRRRATSPFFGGGTPSLLRGAEIARLVEASARAFDLADDAEVTLEANPEDWGRFSEHAAAGINRFSIGAQAFDDEALRALGRRHDAATALKAVEAAAATGKRVS